MKHYSKVLLTSSIAAAALLFGGCGEANSSETPASTAQKVAQAAAANLTTRTGNWDIVTEASHIHFTAQQEGVTFSGGFTTFTGVIDFNPSVPEDGYVEISIPLNSVDAGSKDRNSTLPGKVWFLTKKFPTAVFTSNDITRDGEGYSAKGALTLKGEVVPVVLPFTLKIEGDQAVMIGETRIDRTDWNVGEAPWDTDEWVSKGVKLNIKVTAHRKP